jgi:hypothetical protein
MGRRRSTPPRQRKDQKREHPAPQIGATVAPPASSSAPFKASAQLQVTSELDEIDAGWD